MHFRWGVPLVGEFNYWALLTPSWDPPFSYRECSGRQRSLKAAFKKKAGLWLWYIFVKHVLELLILIYVCVKSDITTLETIVK